MLVAEVISRARAMAYDRFPCPVIYVKKSSSPTWRLKVSSTAVKIEDATPTEKFAFTLNGTLTYKDLLEDLILDDDLFSVAASFAYSENTVVKDLVPCNVSIGAPAVIAKKYLFDDTEIRDLIVQYLMRYGILHCSCSTEDAAIQVELDKVLCDKEFHLIYWLAFHLVEKRRLAEMAGSSLEVVFTNDEDAFCGGQVANFLTQKPIGNLTSSVGDVFSISMDTSNLFNTQEDLSLIGANNVFGDEGFWYRYQMYLREHIEKMWGDFSLRPSQVMTSDLLLEKSYGDHAYFDSFPYEFWAYTKAIPPSCS